MKTIRLAFFIIHVLFITESSNARSWDQFIQMKVINHNDCPMGYNSVGFVITSDSVVNVWLRNAEIDAFNHYDYENPDSNHHVVTLWNGSRDTTESKERLDRLDSLMYVLYDSLLNSGKFYDLVIDTITLSTANVISNSTNCIVYPNPVYDNLVVKSVDVITQIQVFNSSGVEVYKAKPDHANQYSCDVEDLPAGCYFALISTIRRTKMVRIEKH